MISSRGRGTNWQFPVSYHYLASSKTRVYARYLVEFAAQIEPFFAQLGLEFGGRQSSQMPGPLCPWCRGACALWGADKGMAMAIRSTQPNEPIASHPHAFGLGSGHGVVCAVVSGLGGEVTVYIRVILKPPPPGTWAPPPYYLVWL